MLLDRPIDGEAFRAWCEQMLALVLRNVIMENWPPTRSPAYPSRAGPFAQQATIAAQRSQ